MSQAGLKCKRCKGSVLPLSDFDGGTELRCAQCARPLGYVDPETLPTEEGRPAQFTAGQYTYPERASGKPKGRPRGSGKSRKI